MPCQFQCQCGLTKGSEYWLRKAYLKGKDLWRHGPYCIYVYWFAFFSLAWKVTNGQEKLLAFQSGEGGIGWCCWSYLRCYVSLWVKGRGRKEREAQVPTVSNGTGVSSQLPETQMSFILFCFKPCHSQTVKASIAIIKIFNGWYQTIKTDYGCYALWVHPGRISARLLL